MEIKQDNRNELFKRRELVVEIESEKNPSFADVKKMISEKTGKPEENIDVLNIKGKFGKRIFHAEAYLYDSKDDLEKMVELRKTKKQRKEESGEEKEKTEEKSEKGGESDKEPKEEQKSTPVEERVEEKAAEEKKQDEEEAKE